MKLILLDHETDWWDVAQEMADPLWGAVPYCRCGGEAERGTDSCLRCGRHVRALFQPGPFIDADYRPWAAFLRQRPGALA